MRKIIAVYLILVGAIFIFFIPPFQKADETTHFKKALAESKISQTAYEKITEGNAKKIIV